MNLKHLLMTFFFAGFLISATGCDNTSHGFPSQSNQVSAEPDAAPIDEGKPDNSGLVDNSGGAETGDNTDEEDTISLTALTVLPTVSTLATSEQIQFQATAFYSDDSSAIVTNEVTWESDNTDLVTVVNSGLGTAIAAGSTLIRATLTEEGETQSAEVAMTITGPTLTSITVSPKKFLLPASVKKQLIATAQYSDGTTKDITNQVEWTASETILNNPNPGPGVDPIFVTVNSNGVVICHEFDGDDDLDNDTTITATFNGMQDMAELTVFGSGVVADSINVTPTTIELKKGITQQFTATAILSSMNFVSSTDVTFVPEAGSERYQYWGWRSSDPSVVEIDRLTGVATVLTATNTPVEITFERGEDESNLSSSFAMLWVRDAVITSLSIAIPPANLIKGTTESVQVFAHYSDGTTQDISTQPSLTFTLSDESIVDIIDGHQLYARKRGNTDLVASFDGISSNVSNIIVEDNSVMNVSVEPSLLALAKGTLGQLTAIATYNDGTTRDVTNEANWTTSESDAVSVNSSGKVMTNAMPSNANSVQVSVTFRGHHANTNITVKNVAPQSLTVALSATHFAVGEEGKITLIATFSDGSEQDVTELAFMSSLSNTSTVTREGVIKNWLEGGFSIYYGYGFSYNYDTSGDYSGWAFNYDYGYDIALPLGAMPIGITEVITVE